MRALKNIITISCSVAALAWVVHAYHVSENVTPQVRVSPAQSGYTVSIDADGKFVEGPGLVVPIKETDPISFSSSSEGLVERTSTVPGGGIVVDLQGRFRHSMAATVDSDNKLDTDCLSETEEVSHDDGE